MQRRHRHIIQAGSGTQLQKPLLWILEKFYQRMVSEEPVYKAAETVRDRVQKGGHVDCHSVFIAYCTSILETSVQYTICMEGDMLKRYSSCTHNVLPQ